MRDFARAMQARWRCPCAGHSPGPLPADIEREAAQVATVTGTERATTCPFAGIERADDWTRELIGAVSLAIDWHVPIAETLGRDLTRADVIALQNLKQAQADAQRSDAELSRRKHEEISQARHRLDGR